jgi:hypothetical protein
MNTDTNTTSSDTLTVTIVPDARRLAFLPRHFQKYMLAVEGAVYSHMRQLCSSYSGGYWNYMDISNGGCYMALAVAADGLVTLSVPGNGFEGTMSADAAGITVTLFALSNLAFQYPSAEVLADHFHMLREFALEHAEASKILSAID